MESDGKFTVIYSFRIIAGKENDFMNAWSELTKLIYKFAGSYGSRLHKVDKLFFIGYAQWDSKENWENLGDKLPEIAEEYMKQMRESCSEIKTEYEMYLVQDLLHEKRFIDFDNQMTQ